MAGLETMLQELALGRQQHERTAGLGVDQAFDERLGCFPPAGKHHTQGPFSNLTTSAVNRAGWSIA
jgi:hypothetical protein